MQLLQGQAALIEIGADLQGLLRTDVGDDINRIELGDLGETGALSARANHVADVDQMPGHLAVEGRPNLGIAQVQLAISTCACAPRILASADFSSYTQ